MGSSSPEADFISSDISIMSIQELLKGGPLISIPPQFIRLNQEPLSLSDVTSTLPKASTIDMSRLLSGDDDELQKLHSTCQHWGLFELVNHGVSSSLLEKLRREVEEFYKLPLEEKLKFKIREGELEGYGSRTRGDGKLDWADSMTIVTNPLHRRRPHLFPQLPSSLRSTLETYLSELQKLASKLVVLLARALKIDEKEMIELFDDDGTQAVRMAYYPPCPKPELVMGVIPHSDITLLNILHQVNGVDGLQVKKDGLWFPFNIDPEAFVVNVGDILEIFSNGMYHSVEHRVSANKERERITVTFSFSPKYESDVGPSPKLINPSNPPLFRTVGTEQYFNGFFSSRLNGKKYLDHLRIHNGQRQHNSA